MNGWLISILLALVTAAGLLVAARPGRTALQLVVAALLVGLAGYAWQGAPALPGHPTTAEAARRGRDTLFAQERKIWLETVGFDAQQLDGADSFIRNGDADYAVGLLHAYLMREPNSMILWLGYANALQAQADGMLTPAAHYAFGRAAATAPDHPAPQYFLGLAYLQTGDLESADAIWRDLVAKAPSDAPWKARLQARIGLIERFRRAPGGGS